MYLDKENLEDILAFMNNFDHTRVEIIHDNSSGIGPYVEARLHGCNINGMLVTVSKVIIDEGKW